MLEEHFADWKKTELICAFPLTEIDAAKGITNEIAQEFGHWARIYMRETVSISIPDMVNMNFAVRKYSYREKETPKQASLFKEKKSTDIGFLTIVTEETQAFRRAIGEYKQTEGLYSTRLYDMGELPGEQCVWNVVGTQALRQGSRSIISAYHDLVTEFSPRLIILIGIGGGIHKDVSLCDVVVANGAFYYDRRKIAPEREVHRNEPYEMEPWLLSRINEFFTRVGEPAHISAASGSPDRMFKALPGIIGTGEAVIAFKDAPVRDWIRSVNDKTLALETEAGGLGSAFYEEKLQRGPKPGAVLVIRGISDHADKKKDDKWRKPAADNAMIVATKILREFKNLP